MARGRMISKTLGCGSKKFARLRSQHPAVGLFAQALYPLIVANSDDFGRQKGDAFSIKHAVWSTAPEDEAGFQAALEALHAEQLIQRYDIGDETYLQVIDFDTHQQGLHKRTSSRFPEPPGTSGESPLTELNRTEENGTDPVAPSNAADGQRDGFARFWTLYPRQEGKKAAWAAWLEVGPNASFTQQILAAVANQRQTVKAWQEAIASGDCTYVKMPEKWLLGGHWDDQTFANAGSVKPACRRHHHPPCPDDATCTARYLRELRGEPSLAGVE